MRGINKVIIVGTLGSDPEVRYAPDSRCVATLSVATNENWTDKSPGEKKQLTEWHRVVIWGRLAEVAGEYLRKGSPAYFEGKLRTRKWQDKDGIERYTTEIIASDMQMLGNPNGQQMPQQAPAQQQQARQPQGRQAMGKPAPVGYQGQMGTNPNQQRAPMDPPIDFDDDIPF